MPRKYQKKTNLKAIRKEEPENESGRNPRKKNLKAVVKKDIENESRSRRKTNLKAVVREDHDIEIVVCDINGRPEDDAPEIPPHPKKRRKSRSSSPAPLPRASPSPSQTPPPAPESYSVPTPAAFVECQESRQQQPPPPLRPKHINYGSEPESDDSDDEEESVYPVISRVFRSLMETPLDQDYADEDAATDTSDTVPAEGPSMKTGQPWGPSPINYHFDWRPFPGPSNYHKSNREKFSATNVGPTTPRTDPYDIFIEIWDRQIMEHIVSETNKYAQQVASQLLKNHELTPRSRIGQWRDTTVDELYVYFGIVLAMGIVVKSRLEEYWATNRDIFVTPGFSAHMSTDRFRLLSKCLHFNNNEDMCAQELNFYEAKLFKIQPILSHLNKKFQEMYTPARNISIDESLLMWKGWQEFSKCPIKTYEICESRTGYLWRFEVHTRSKKSPQHGDPLEASTPSTVIQLLQGLEHKGYTVWMDDFYNSPCLARRLKSLGFDCVGTLRTDRPYVPQSLHSLTKRNMHPGQIAGLTSGDVNVMVWRTKNRVAMISTYHDNATAKGSTKPILLLDYKTMMGGVDKKDQILATYPIERKRSMVWYKKLFKRLLNVSVLNAYIIQHHNNSSRSHRNFRKELVTSLLSKHSTALPILPILKTKVDVSHRIAYNPYGIHHRLRRTCVICKNKACTYCVGCNKTVCIETCFLTIHS